MTFDVPLDLSYFEVILDGNGRGRMFFEKMEETLQCPQHDGMPCIPHSESYDSWLFFSYGLYLDGCFLTGCCKMNIMNMPLIAGHAPAAQKPFMVLSHLSFQRVSSKLLRNVEVCGWSATSKKVCPYLLTVIVLQDPINVSYGVCTLCELCGENTNYGDVGDSCVCFVCQDNVCCVTAVFIKDK
jgi:hypothetical protein